MIQRKRLRDGKEHYSVMDYVEFLIQKLKSKRKNQERTEVPQKK